MNKKAIVFIMVLALAVMAFSPMVIAADVRHEYGTYQTEYGTAYNILPAPYLDYYGYTMTDFVTIQAGKKLLAPVYQDNAGQEYVLVNPACQFLDLIWMWPWEGEINISDAVLVPLTESNFIGFFGHDAAAESGDRFYFVRNLVPHNFPFWL